MLSMKHSVARYVCACLILALSFILITLNTAQAADPRLKAAARQAAARALPPETMDYGVVTEVLKPDLIKLENGKAYKLANIRVPIYYKKDALTALNELLVGKQVLVYHYADPVKAEEENTVFSAANETRYGVKLTHVIVEESNIWVQDYLIANGYSWAFSTPDAQTMMPTLKKVEQLARQQRLGFWGANVYRIKNVEEVKNYLDSYQIVEGKITNVTKKSYAAYLNFGQDWTTDFTITLPREHWNTFATAYFKFDPRHLEGMTVRVRGWVENKNGPMISVDHVEQMEILSNDKRWKRIDVAPPSAEQGQ